MTESLEVDLLEGAREIATFLFGAGASQKRAYVAIRHGLPVWRIGNRVFARKSRIAKWIEEQEQRRY